MHSCICPARQCWLGQCWLVLYNQLFLLGTARTVWSYPVIRSVSVRSVNLLPVFGDQYRKKTELTKTDKYWTDFTGFVEKSSYWSVQFSMFSLFIIWVVDLNLQERTETGLITGSARLYGPCIAAIAGICISTATSQVLDLSYSEGLSAHPLFLLH